MVTLVYRWPGLAASAVSPAILHRVLGPNCWALCPTWAVTGKGKQAISQSSWLSVRGSLKHPVIATRNCFRFKVSYQQIVHLLPEGQVDGGHLVHPVGLLGGWGGNGGRWTSICSSNTSVLANCLLTNCPKNNQQPSLQLFTFLMCRLFMVCVSTSPALYLSNIYFGCQDTKIRGNVSDLMGPFSILFIFWLDERESEIPNH